MYASYVLVKYICISHGHRINHTYKTKHIVNSRKDVRVCVCVCVCVCVYIYIHMYASYVLVKYICIPHGHRINHTYKTKHIVNSRKDVRKQG